MFCFHADLTVKLAKLSNSHLLDGGIPALTSSAIMSRIFQELFNLRQGNFEVLDDSSSTVNATVFSYFGGAIGARLPDKNAWMHAYEGDPITVALKDLASTPSLITKKNLEKVPFFYRSPVRKGCIVIADEFLVLKEPQSNHSYQITRI